MKIIRQSHVVEEDLSADGVKNLMQRIEKAARTCYKSEDKMDETGESAARLIRSLIKNGHEAMLEHASLTVRFTTDRGVSHELVRHRMAAFAQESTRWCNYSDGKFGGEITVIKPIEFEGLDEDKKQEACNLLSVAMYDSSTDANEANYCLMEMGRDYIAYAHWESACMEAENAYMQLLRLNFTPQMARSVLPNSLKTEVVVTANIREWRHILRLRTAKDAHPQMRALMLGLLKQLKEKLPVLFEDIKEMEDDEYADE